MDTRNGDMYPSREAAIDAGVPEANVIEPYIVPNGPFKGRRYERLPNGKLGRRIRDRDILQLKADAERREADATEKRDSPRRRWPD